MSNLNKYQAEQKIPINNSIASETLPINDVFTNKYYVDNATNYSLSQESLNNELSELRKNYNHLQQWYNYTVSHCNELKKTIECRDAEIQYLYDEIARKNAEKIAEDEKKTEDWWNTVNLDKIELDAQIQLNKKYAGMIDKFKQRISKNRKYSRKLLKRNKMLSQLKKTQDEVAINTIQSKEKSIKQIFYTNNQHVFRNLCMTTVYGRVPAIALWNSEDIKNFTSDYWFVWSEKESSKIIKMLVKNYKEFPDLIQFINEHVAAYKNDSINNYNCLVLKNLANWLFS